jgi:hypothetical protein
MSTEIQKKSKTTLQKRSYLQLKLLKKRDFIKSRDHSGLFIQHTFFSLHCCGIYV